MQWLDGGETDGCERRDGGAASGGYGGVYDPCDLGEAVLGLPSGPVAGPADERSQAGAAPAVREDDSGEAPARTGGRLPDDGADIIADLVQRVEHLEDAGRTGRLLEAYIETMSKELRTLTARIDRLAQHMVGTVGFRVRESFQCDSCGSRHNVAARIVCTSCQKESWWGWWPEEKT